MPEPVSAVPPVAGPIQLGAVVPLGDPLVDVQAGAALPDDQVTFSWLFQSQSQRGTASAKPSDEDPEPNGLRLPLQFPLNLGHCGGQ